MAATNLHNSRGTLSTHARCVNCELGRYATPSRGVGGYTYGGIVQGPWREASSEKLDSIVPSDVLRCVRFVRGDLSSFLGSAKKTLYDISLVGLKTKYGTTRICVYTVDNKEEQIVDEEDGGILVLPRLRTMKKRINVWVDGVGVGVGFVTRGSYVTTWKRSKTG